jgi:ABC-type Fe3+-hydroxamate transport system substrate-binding protein
VIQDAGVSQTFSQGDDIMKKRGRFKFFVLTALAIVLSGCASTQSSPQSAPPQNSAPPSAAPVAGIAAETVLTVHGKIVSVDQASKQVTLEGPNGKDITLTVNNPYNLQSLKAGDRYVAQFTEAVTIVAKGPSEKPPVATLSAGLWTANPGATPGAVVARQAHLVVVISAIDLADQRVTLQAPDGSTENIHVTNPEGLQGVQIGDRIAITLTQSVAIALAPEASSTQ